MCPQNTKYVKQKSCSLYFRKRQQKKYSSFRGICALKDNVYSLSLPTFSFFSKQKREKKIDGVPNILWFTSNLQLTGIRILSSRSVQTKEILSRMMTGSDISRYLDFNPFFLSLHDPWACCLQSIGSLPHPEWASGSSPVGRQSGALHWHDPLGYYWEPSRRTLNRTFAESKVSLNLSAAFGTQSITKRSCPPLTRQPP